MKKKQFSLMSAILAVGLSTSMTPSQAGLVSLESLTASWLDPAPTSAANVSGNGTDSASLFWGRPASRAGQSGYNFTTAATPISYEVPPPTPDFVIGTWTHYNNPVFAPSLDSVRLMLSADISVDSISQGTMNFYFDFTHNETANNARLCANGGANRVGVNVNGCADIVDISYNTLSDSFLVDGTLFTLNLAGGSNYFETVESLTNTFDVYASIVATNSAVPEPSSLILLASGLLGIGAARKKINRS
jgi:hypothetical protein